MMTHTELQQIQTTIKFDAPSMALCLGLDYEQYRRYFYGHTKIPDKIKRAALELLQIDKQFNIEMGERLDKVKPFMSTGNDFK